LLPDALFQPHVTTKGAEGSGIGLHICKVIVKEKLAGKKSAANWADGAEFTIELPIVPDYTENNPSL